MHNITKIDKKDIWINALYVQPTTKCMLSCKGCYVKEWEAKNTFNEEQVPSISFVLRDILASMHKNNFKNQKHMLECRFKVNQITFAVDNLPKNGRWSQEIRSLTRAFMNVYEPDEAAKYERHITVNNLVTLLGYFTAPDILKKSSIFTAAFKLLDLVTISNIPSIKMKELIWMLESFKENGIQINYNLLVDPMNTQFKIDFMRTKIYKSIDLIKAGILDSVYLLLHKPPLGCSYDKAAIDNYEKAWEMIPEEYKKYFNRDGCITDSENFIQNDTYCSSNISRFQVQPNGTVSGCPYSSRSYGRPFIGNVEKDVQTFLENIRIASRMRDFNRCQIPTAMKPELELLKDPLYIG